VTCGDWVSPSSPLLAGGRAWGGGCAPTTEKNRFWISNRQIWCKLGAFCTVYLNWNCVPGNAVPTVKITFGTAFRNLCLAFHHLKLPFHHLKLSLHHLHHNKVFVIGLCDKLTVQVSRRCVTVRASNCIFGKIIIIVATRGQILRLKSTKFPRWGSLQVTSLPQTLSWI